MYELLLCDGLENITINVFGPVFQIQHLDFNNFDNLPKRGAYEVLT